MNEKEFVNSIRIILILNFTSAFFLGSCSNHVVVDKAGSIWMGSTYTDYVPTDPNTPNFNKMFYPGNTLYFDVSYNLWQVSDFIPGMETINM